MLWDIRQLKHEAVICLNLLPPFGPSWTRLMVTNLHSVPVMLAEAE